MKLLSVFQFVIVGTFGETPETDIAVDAVCVTPCEGEKMSIRYNKKKIAVTFGNFRMKCMPGKRKNT